MKKLGLIGGTGVESTILYYRNLTYGVKNALCAELFPPLVIESLSVFRVLEFCEKQDYTGLADYILRGIENLAHAGAEFATLTGITPHIVFDEVASRSPIELLSIIDTACAYAKNQGFSKLALLATLPTMKATFFQKPFAKNAIEMVLPSDDEMEFIGLKIKNEIEHGKILDTTKEVFIKIAQRLIPQDNAQAIVLGCTELPLLFDEVTLDKPFVDVVMVHIDELIKRILED